MCAGASRQSAELARPRKTVYASVNAGFISTGDSTDRRTSVAPHVPGRPCRQARTVIVEHELLLGHVSGEQLSSGSASM
jgi:hypothetical protein